MKNNGGELKLTEEEIEEAKRATDFKERCKDIPEKIEKKEVKYCPLSFNIFAGKFMLVCIKNNCEWYDNYSNKCRINFI